MSFHITCPRCGKPVASESTVFLCACGTRTVGQWQADVEIEPEPKPLPGLDGFGDAEARP